MIFKRTLRSLCQPTAISLPDPLVPALPLWYAGSFTILPREESHMPVLEPVSDEHAAAAAKATFEKLHAKLKMVPNIFGSSGNFGVG
jgi:hypothetical protein